MSLITPEKIRTLQRKLYIKAKQEPAFRFYALYDKVCREDILNHAWRLVRANRGAPGVDGVGFAAIESGEGVERFLRDLSRELQERSYRAQPVRRIISPLLSNVYLHILDRIWQRHDLCGKLGAHLVRYADDFVVLCKRGEEEPFKVVRQVPPVSGKMSPQLKINFGALRW